LSARFKLAAAVVVGSVALSGTALTGSALADDGPTGSLPDVHPTPQSMTRLPGTVVLPGRLDVVAARGADQAALDLTRQVLSSAGVASTVVTADQGRAGDVVLTVGAGDSQTQSALTALGVKGTDALPPQGYVLAAGVDPTGVRRVVLAGTDAVGTYYAAQTLRQVIVTDAGRPMIPGLQVRDWPGYAIRGGMESFYGPVWSQADRRAQVEFLARNKMNQYFYGPAGDPRTGTDWSARYDADELARMKQIVDLARERHVDFVYRVSPEAPMAPANGICHSRQSDLDKLVARFEQLWAIGIRSYVIAWDDVSGGFACDEDRSAFEADASPLAAAQAHVTNYVQDAFIAKHDGASRMVTVPTEYWGTATSTYRTRFDTLLATTVDIYWTGPQVVARSITNDDVDRVRAAFPRHRIMVWDNYPVNDYASNRLLLGPTTNREAGIESKVLGISFNEMVEQAPSQVALGTQADLAWNPAAYDPERSWTRVLRQLGGDAYPELRLFAENNRSSILDPTEPPTVTTLVDTLLADYSAGKDVTRPLGLLDDELARLEALPAQLRTKLVDPLMVSEIRPWLERLGRYGAAGQDALAILRAQSEGDAEAAWRARRAQADNRSVLDGIPQQVTPGPLEALLDYAAKQSDGFIGDRWFADTASPTGTPQAAPGSSLALLADRRDDTAYVAAGAPKAGDAVTVPLVGSHRLSSVTVVQNADKPARATVQAQRPDGTWATLGSLQRGYTSVPAPDLEAQAIRLSFEEGGPAPVIYEVVPHYRDVLAGTVTVTPASGLVAAGDTKRLTVQVEAQDPATLRATVAVDAPSGWVAAPQSQRITMRANGRTLSSRSTLDLTVPAGTAIGEYHATVTVTTDAGATKRVPLTFTVAQRPTGSYPDLVSGAEPSGYWRLSEASGTAATDSSATEQPGTYLDGAHPGTAGALEGDTGADLTTGYVEVPRAPATNLSGPFTLEGWVKLDRLAPAPGQAVIESYSAPARNGFALRVTDGRLQAWTMSGTGYGLVTGKAVMTAGQWHHVAATFDGSSLRVYLDGMLDASSATTVAPTPGEATIKLGGRGDDAAQRLGGSLDEVAIYPTALSPEAISAHFLAAGRP
jgi:hyaluronoglucosaminidase